VSAQESEGEEDKNEQEWELVKQNKLPVTGISECCQFVVTCLKMAK
jgi:hypothetical protein